MSSKINHKVLKEIEGIVGRKDFLMEETDIEPYTHDETPGLKGFPEAVARPHNPSQIKEIVKLANSELFPVVPRGGGTGLSGGAVPVKGGLVLSLEKMGRILDLDKDNFTVTVEAGVINGILQREVEKEALFYPVNPASMDSCTIGGNVAEACGGANTVRYGTTRNYILALKAIVGDGKEVSLGGKVVKNATDHHLIQLFLGSEGTLGVITEVTLRLLSKPRFTSVLLIPFPEITRIPQVSLEIFQKGYLPTMVEIMDRKTLQYCAQYKGSEVQYPERDHLLVRLDGEEKEILEKNLLDIGELALNMGAEDVLVLDTLTAQRKIWEFRQAIHDALIHEGGCLADEDVVVPRARIPDLIRGCRELSSRHRIPVVVFGHLGDGNIHVNFLSEDLDKEETLRRLPPAIKELFQLTVNLGGRISGEHGIGVYKKPYLPLSVHPKFLNLMRGIKQVFDPHHILNPGKFYDRV